MSTASSPPLPKAFLDYDYQSYEKCLPPSPKPASSSGRSPSSRSSKERPRGTPTAKELMQMLAEEQETTRDLQQELTLTSSQLTLEQDRADAAERKIKEAVIRFKDANDARLAAQAEAARLREELKLYKGALEEAQKEIFKAQNILRDVEARKGEAEEEATQLRRKLRKMQEEKMIEVAREEGRKQGLQEGIEMGKDIGYLRGRNQGYINGRLTADRMMDKYFSPPSESEVRRSRGEPELPSDSEPPYTVTTTRFPGTAATSSTSSGEGEVPRYTRPGGTRPSSSARTTLYSPAQENADTPHDGFIPEADASNVIRLPPPHEFARSGSGGSSSPHMRPVPVPGDVPVLMVPEPRSPRNPGHELGGDRQQRKVRRRSSRESVCSSTRTSELDLLNAPEHAGDRGHRSRSSGLSVIPEGDSSMSSVPREGEDRVDEAGFVHVSMPAPLTAAEMASLKARSGSQTLSVEKKGHSRPGSTSSFGTVNITIQPPSRPASNNSATTTRPHLLSPADADRPVPLPGIVETIEMELGDGGLPPGFVPATGYTAAGVPLPPSTVGTYHSRLPSHDVVIPPRLVGGEEESTSSEDTESTRGRVYRR